MSAYYKSKRLNEFSSVIRLRELMKHPNGTHLLEESDKLLLVRLVVEEGYTAEEVAIATGIKTQNIYRYVRRARQGGPMKRGKGRSPILDKNDEKELLRVEKKHHL